MVTDVIRWQQRTHVKVSTGTLAHEAFTDDDLHTFKARKVPGRVVAAIAGTDDFEAVRQTFEAAPPAERERILRVARTVGRPTWREMGFIDREGRGQTEAGREAERLLAEAIVAALVAENAGRE